MPGLVKNANHEGKTVRWASAMALGKIIEPMSSQNEKLVPKIFALAKDEKDGWVKKKYLSALKKIGAQFTP